MRNSLKTQGKTSIERGKAGGAELSGLLPAGHLAPRPTQTMHPLREVLAAYCLGTRLHLAALSGLVLMLPLFTLKAAPGPASVWGRDTWTTAGLSRVFRVVSSEDLVSPGLTPTASFTPGPVTVNYILVGTPCDLTISVTVPPEASPGVQTLRISDGVLSHSIPDALRIVDATIPNPSPSVLPLGGSAILSIAPHPLFSGQSSFSLDLGPDVSVGPIAPQPDGSLAVPVSVLASAIPGTRSLHLTAGPYTLLAERGFAIDFGTPDNIFHLQINTSPPDYMDVKVPKGYQADIFAAPTAQTGLAGPGDMYVDEKNVAYILNHGSYEGAPFSISVFDLSPANFGAVKGVFKDIDPSGRGGLLESAEMLPSRPGKLLYSAEDFTGHWPGGRTISELDVATGETRLFWLNLDWNLDPIEKDAAGNLAVSHTIRNTVYQGYVSILDPDANVLKTCPSDNWTDGLRMDPLSGKFAINTPPSGPGGLQTFDASDCSRQPRSDGPRFDEGSFGSAAGDFGNQHFIAEEGKSSIYTMVPVAYDDPDQSVPQRAVLFATGFRIADTVWFDRDARHMLVTDSNVSHVFAIKRIPGYAPPMPVASLSLTSLTFGAQEVGTASAPQTVTLANTGAATLTIASIAASPDYTESNTCGYELAPGSSCTIDISFTPIGPGTRSGYIAITNNASPQPDVISVTGMGIGPGVSFSPAALDFALQLVGTTSSPQTVILTNSGNTPLTISNVLASGDYAQFNTCLGTFAPGENCTITVTFTPTAAGSRPGTVTVSDNAWGSPQAIPLSGIGALPAVTLSTTVLIFPDQPLGTTGGPQVVTLINTGNAPLNISGIATTNDYAQTNTCITPVLAGASCSISVTFTPAIVGGQSGTLTITDDAPGSPHTVALNGIGLGSAASLSTRSLLFPDQPVGTTSDALIVYLGSSGNLPLNITSIAASGNYHQTNDCPTSLPVQAYCTIRATFTPTVPGGQSGTLTIIDDAPDSPHTVALNGIGLGSAASLSTTYLLFPDQPVGTTSEPLTVNLGSSGNLPLNITNITASGNYTQTSNCPSQLAIRTYCTISVSFTPQVVGGQSGTLTISDDAPGSPHTVALNGVGLGPVVTLSAFSLRFANQPVGTTSAPQNLALGNSGNVPLTIGSIAASGEFAQTNDCTSPLAAGSYCTISVTFTPTAPGDHNGTLTIPDNAAGSPHTVALSGVGLGPLAILSASSLSFADQQRGTTSAAQTVTLTNNGNTPLNISSIEASADFAQTSDCISPLAAGSYCTISVTFTPTALGAIHGALTVTDDAPGSPHTVTLSGTSLGPEVALSASSLDFAGQVVGTTSAAQVITLSNAGNAALVVSSIAASGDFAQTNTCGSSVAAGASCSVNVTFAPTEAGIRNGALTITDDALGSPHVVNLSGIGQDFSIRASATSRTITAGSAAAYVLFVTPLGGLSTTVSLRCSGAPAEATCRVSPDSVTLTGLEPVQTTVTVITTARSSSMPRTHLPQNPRGLPGVWHAGPLNAVGVLTLVGLLTMLVLGRRQRVWLPLGLILLLAVLWIACGGGGERTPTGTPAGTYTLTVTATSTSGLTHSIKLTLIVN